MSLSGGVNALAARVAQEVNTLRAEMSSGNLFVTSFLADSTEHVISHNLGTQDVLVQLFWNEAPFRQFWATIDRDTANSVTIRFETAPNENVKVVVQGALVVDTAASLDGGSP